MSIDPLHPTVLNPDVLADLVILCDHASNHVPEHLGQLGLDDVHFEDHIAVDIGAAEVSEMMASMMTVPAVLASVSRLVIDVNRDLDHAGLIPPASDGIQVPGNRGLSADHSAARVSAYYEPFHDAAAGLVARHLEAERHPFIMGMHSFTPNMNGEARPWHVGLMYNGDPRLAEALRGILERETDLNIGINVPYCGTQLFHTMQRHGADHGLPAVTVEIRNDLLRRPDHQEEWAVLMANSLDELFGREDLGRLR